MIRSARVDDVDAVLELWRVGDAHPSVTDDSDSLRKLLECDGDALWVAEERGRVVGSIIAGWDGWRVNLYRLVVHPELRRHGIARALVTAAEESLRARGAVRFSAIVLRANPIALEFWRVSGYAHDSRVDRYVKTLGRTDPARSSTPTGLLLETADDEHR